MNTKTIVKRATVAGKSVLFALASILPASNVWGGNILHVPMSWCVVQGSPAQANPNINGDTNTDAVIWRRHERPTDNVFTPQADISLRSAINDAWGSFNFPVIADPDTSTSCGVAECVTNGDIRGEDVNVAAIAVEFNNMINSCQTAYAPERFSPSARACASRARWRATGLPHLMPALVAFLGGFLAGLGGGILAGTSLSQRGIDSWREADAPWWVVLGAVLASGLLGVAAARLASGLPGRALEPVPSGASPVMDLTSGERAVWSDVSNIERRADDRPGPYRRRSGRRRVFGLGHSCCLLSAASPSVASQRSWSASMRPVWRCATGCSHGPGRTSPLLRASPARRGSPFVPASGVAGATVAAAGSASGCGGPPLGSRHPTELRDGTVFAVTIDEPDDGVALLNAEIARTPAFLRR